MPKPCHIYARNTSLWTFLIFKKLNIITKYKIVRHPLSPLVLTYLGFFIKLFIWWYKPVLPERWERIVGPQSSGKGCKRHQKVGFETLLMKGILPHGFFIKRIIFLPGVWDFPLHWLFLRTVEVFLLCEVSHFFVGDLQEVRSVSSH